MRIVLDQGLSHVACRPSPGLLRRGCTVPNNTAPQSPTSFTPQSKVLPATRYLYRAPVFLCHGHRVTTLGGMRENQIELNHFDLRLNTTPGQPPGRPPCGAKYSAAATERRCLAQQPAGWTNNVGCVCISHQHRSVKFSHRGM